MTAAFLREARARGASAVVVLRYGSLEASRARPLVAARVRALLGDMCGVSVDESDFVRDEHGKPALRGARGVWFNVSHGARASLFALSDAGEIGCDIEDRLRDDDVERVGPLVLHDDERRFMAALADDEERRTAFARCWVRKEAVLKARGFGFALDARTVDTALHVEQPSVRVGDGPPFVIHDAPPRLAITAAVACAARECAWHVEALA